MFKKEIAFLTPSYESLKSRTVFFILLSISIFIRFPFFFRDYIDRDESTFILMGQSWVNGHLPYTELWDVKPPLTFLFFAGIIYVFGKSFLAIRFFGALAVAITALFTYKIGSKIDSKKIGFWSAIICVILQSMFGSLQGVMSEHICMPFFMAALYLIIKSQKPSTYLISGLLMGITVMVKLNMAYAALFVGLHLSYTLFQKKGFFIATRNVIAYGIGIILIISLTILPYHLQGNFDLWWKSVIEAPLNYAGARRNSIIETLPFYIVIVGFLFFAWKKKKLDYKNPDIQLLLVTIIGVLLSFIKGGRINGHYLIQLFPFLVILVGIVFRKIIFLQRTNYKIFIPLLFLLLPIETYLEYVTIIKNKLEKGTFYNGEGFSVPHYITENNLETKNMLFLGYHIGYWVLGVDPPTKSATQPSNICKEEMFFAYDNPRDTSIEEIQYILEELKPKTIVVRENRSIFDKKQVEENIYINNYLAEHYKTVEIVEKAEILQRLEQF